MSATVASASWHESVVEQVVAGHTWLDLLTAVDRGDVVELVLRLVDPASPESTVLRSRLDAAAPSVASLTDLLPAAGWHEREIAEMFGVEFLSHPDPRPLLLRRSPDQPPLRRSTPLHARLEQTWPGSAGATERRRSRATTPPGVRPLWVEGTGS